MGPVRAISVLKGAAAAVFVVFALVFVLHAARAQSFPAFVDGSPAAAVPLSATDALPLIQGPPGARATHSLLIPQLQQGVLGVAVTGAFHATSAVCGEQLLLGGGASYTVTVDAAGGYPSNCILAMTNTDASVGK